MIQYLGYYFQLGSIMKIYTMILILIFGCTSTEKKRKIASIVDMDSHLEMVSLPGGKLKIRAGYFLEKEKLRGCVLFLQGLGDSIRNHDPYFNFLNNSGYRVISFDYMGQGGSEGKMNNTRVSTSFPPDITDVMQKNYNKKGKYYEIGNQAEYVWDYFSDIENEFGENCKSSKKLVIGWSTGGLAAYKMANDLKADAVVLIAPGIHIKFMVGESQNSPVKLISLQKVITERTLTRNDFSGEKNPHIDPIVPASPAHVPQFAGNLYLTSKKSHSWSISKHIPGIVFLSGKEDSYVDRNRTTATVNKNSPHFKLTSYEGALHELDNEISEVTDDLYLKTTIFLDSIK